jgi:threonine/homoserine/homoserine lactone efflux protein
VYLISDIVLIYLVETILQQFPFDSIKTQIGVIGGIMLIVFGIVTYFAKATLKAQDVTSVKTLFQAFLKGVSLNMFNPFVTVWWITMYTTITINYDTFTDRFLFYFGILFMVFLFDLLKMRFAYYLKQRLTETNLSVIKKVVGACLFVFGVVMIVKVV